MAISGDMDICTASVESADGRIAISVLPHADVPALVVSEPDRRVWTLVIDDRDPAARTGYDMMLKIGSRVEASCHVVFDDEEAGGTGAIGARETDIIASFARSFARMTSADHRPKDELGLPARGASGIHLIVTCRGGVSRSAAVGAAIGDLVGVGDTWVFGNGSACPNETVFRECVHAMGLEEAVGGEDGIAERMELNRNAWRKAKEERGEL